MLLDAWAWLASVLQSSWFRCRSRMLTGADDLDHVLRRPLFRLFCRRSQRGLVGRRGSTPPPRAPPPSCRALRLRGEASPSLSRVYRATRSQGQDGQDQGTGQGCCRAHHNHTIDSGVKHPHVDRPRH